MKNIIKSIRYLLLAVVCASCAVSNSDTTEQQPATSKPAMQCEEPRPEICTQEYMPVCAATVTGLQCVTTPCPETEEKTYPNGCTACSDVKVISYQPGECPSP